MPISKERFEQGLTAQEYLDTVEANRERFLANLEAASEVFTDEDRAFFEQHPISVAALGEDWCTDVVQFFPLIIKLAEENPSITLRIFPRDQNLDIMDQYLNQGEFRSIPTFVIYDPDWNELGHIIERTSRQTNEMAQETRRFAQENAHLEGINRAYNNMPDETRNTVRENNARYRWERMLEWNRWFLDEFKDIAARSTAKAGS